MCFDNEWRYILRERERENTTTKKKKKKREALCRLISQEWLLTSLVLHYSIFISINNYSSIFFFSFLLFFNSIFFHFSIPTSIVQTFWGNTNTPFLVRPIRQTGREKRDCMVRWAKKVKLCADLSRGNCRHGYILPVAAPWFPGSDEWKTGGERDRQMERLLLQWEAEDWDGILPHCKTDALSVHWQNKTQSNTPTQPATSHSKIKDSMKWLCII